MAVLFVAILALQIDASVRGPFTHNRCVWHRGPAILISYYLMMRSAFSPAESIPMGSRLLFFVSYAAPIWAANGVATLMLPNDILNDPHDTIYKVMWVTTVRAIRNFDSLTGACHFWLRVGAWPSACNSSALRAHASTQPVHTCMQISALSQRSGSTCAILVYAAVALSLA